MTKSVSQGQRAYIERRIAQFSERAQWLRVAIEQPWAQDWHRDELAELDGRIAALKARIT